MDYLRKIEEDLRNIALKANVKRRYPDVIQAAEDAVDALKSIREVYVSEVSVCCYVLLCYCVIVL
jgi:hypothetical protein